VFDTFSQRVVVSRSSKATRFDDYTYSHIAIEKEHETPGAKGGATIGKAPGGVIRVCLRAICAAYRAVARGAET